MKAGSATWWSAKVRQARRHLTAAVSDSERAALDSWLSAAEQDLFDQMHLADRRHGLDVVAWLLGDGIADRDVLVAGLLHDAGKGSTGFAPRVVHSLGQAYGGWIPRLARLLPAMREPLERLERHAESSAKLAAGAGCSSRTVELIRHQDDPAPGDLAGHRLQLADDAC